MNIGKLLGIIGIILMATFLLVAARNILSNGKADAAIVSDIPAVYNGEEQVVDLTVKDYNYFPQIINLKYNVPAKIIVDTDKVKGCLQSIVIPDFKIRKFVTSKDNVISFTPDKKGTFSFSCSMGMGFGKVVVS